MRITANTMLFVVRNDPRYPGGDGGVTHLTLEGLVNAVQGGMKLSEVTVFTGLEEADEYSRRVKLVSKAAHLLRDMDLYKLAELVNRMESDEIDELLDKVMG